MAATYPQIIVTGDSLALAAFDIGGYGLALAAEYAGRADVINRGMGGYNSRQLLYKMQTDMHIPTGGEVVLFVIHIGSNDCVLEGGQIVHLDEFRSNLSAIIAHIRTTFPKAAIIFLTTTIFDQEATQAMFSAVGIDKAPNERSDENSKRYADACVEVGEAEGVPVINTYKIHKAMVDHGLEAWRIVPDGLHLSPKGYAPLSRELIATIKSSFPNLVPSQMPEPFEFFLKYGEGTPAASDPEGVKKTMAVFKSFGPDIRDKLGDYVKKRSAEA